MDKGVLAAASFLELDKASPHSEAEAEGQDDDTANLWVYPHQNPIEGQTLYSSIEGQTLYSPLAVTRASVNWVWGFMCVGVAVYLLNSRDLIYESIMLALDLSPIRALSINHGKPLCKSRSAKS